MTALKEAGMKRFLDKIRVDDNSCWIWTACVNSAGYGQFKIDGVCVLAHRFAHELFIGPIPKDMFVCHICDVPGCVNPKHLWLGTQKDNMQDSMEKGRHRSFTTPLVTHCKHGHEYTHANSYIRLDGRAKECRTCIRDRGRVARASL